MFVEARTAGGDDWTTLPDANGHTSQDTGACPYNYLDFNPFYEHYVTPFIADRAIRTDPERTTSCAARRPERPASGTR